MADRHAHHHRRTPPRRRRLHRRRPTRRQLRSRRAHTHPGLTLPEKDYSATPLGSKLGAKSGVEVLVLFTTTRDELERRFAALKATLAPADGLWVAWPKKASAIETDLDFATVQSVGLDAGLVDNKSCAIDRDWQALRFVYRKTDRPR
jgi:hypothetical protein